MVTHVVSKFLLVKTATALLVDLRSLLSMPKRPGVACSTTVYSRRASRVSRVPANRLWPFYATAHLVDLPVLWTVYTRILFSVELSRCTCTHVTYDLVQVSVFPDRPEMHTIGCCENFQLTCSPGLFSRSTVKMQQPMHTIG